MSQAPPRAPEGRPLPSLAGAEWLTRPSTRAVLAAIAAGGHEARAVGGAVRNALLALPVKDVDLATTARPEEVMALAERAGLKAVPTGIAHGTVTIVSGHHPFEVTTLRKDIETDGRRAVVHYTRDWREDALRRDFTINAIYCDSSGTLYDPLGGYADVASRRIRFIGDPHERIREDYLRILRFFRLSAEYGAGALDAEGLQAATEERGGLTLLSGERIRGELMRLLGAPRALRSVEAMATHGILELLVGATPSLRMLARLIDIEHHLTRAPDPTLRLAALAVHAAEDAPRLAERLRLSRVEADRLESATIHDVALGPGATEPLLRAFLYRHGVACFLDATLIDWSRGDDPVDDPARIARLALAESWTPPRLPFRGADVLALGLPKGSEVGEALARFEAWWIEADFPDDPDLLRGKLADVAKDLMKG